MEDYDRTKQFICEKCRCQRPVSAVEKKYIRAVSKKAKEPSTEHLELKCPDCGYIKKYSIITYTS